MKISKLKRSTQIMNLDTAKKINNCICISTVLQNKLLFEQQGRTMVTQNISAFNYCLMLNNI